MKKLLIVFAVLIVFVAIIFFWYTETFNKMVVADEAVTAQWGNVENQYQRRSDLIPNLVATVKGYATHEQNTLEGVIEARAKATQITVDPTNITPEALAEFQSTQSGVTSALNRLLVSIEAYPDLKADQHFLDLQSQLEGTENRIATERTRFNETANTLNTLIRKFPSNIIAGISGFSEKPYFQAEQGASQAPKVEF